MGMNLATSSGAFAAKRSRLPLAITQILWLEEYLINMLITNKLCF
jgi:hypothetical protein